MTFVVEDLRAGYGAAQVLHGVSLTVNPGETVAVLGPNGAGKTTLLRSVFRTCTVMSGVIMMDGKDLMSLPDYKVSLLGIGHVPEGRGLFPELTVEENLTVGGLALRSRGRIRSRIADIIEMFPALKDRRSQVVGTMSGGEQQMVAIGRALMPEPHLLMLDEPSLGLAPRIVTDIFGRLRELTGGEGGLATLIVEQRVQEALDLCDRAYVLEGGAVVTQGEPDDLRANELLVEAFFGGPATGAAVPIRGEVEHPGKRS